MAPSTITSVPGDISAVDLTNLLPSLTNPRQSFQGEEFDELVSSIRQHGVLQPVLVRPTICTEAHLDRFNSILHPIDCVLPEVGDETYELVCGERRYRAALKAGLETIPAVVRQLSDAEAREIQIVENAQREGIPALEEGEAFRQLADLMGHENPALKQAEIVQTIASRVGKSTRYVYARMQLTGLIPEVKQALSEGKIEASHADVLVRLGHDQQREIFEHDLFELEPIPGQSGGGAKIVEPTGPAVSVRELKRRIEDDAQPLKKAAWKWEKDTAETPAIIGSPVCVGCEQNTASQDGADPKNARCLNEDCFAAKTKRFIDVRIHDLETTTGKASVRVSKSEYSVPKGAKSPSQWRTAKPGSCDHVVPALIVNYSNEWEGVTSVCLEKKCKEHWPKDTSGEPAAPAARKLTPEEIEAAQQEVRERNADRAIAVQVISAVKSLGPVELSIVADGLASGYGCGMQDEDVSALFGLFGWKPVQKWDVSQEFFSLFEKHAAKLTPQKLAQATMVLAVSAASDTTEAIETLAKHYKLDLKAIRAKLIADQKSASEKKAEPKSAAKKPVPKKAAKKASAKKGGRK